MDILLVEDDADDARFLQACLAREDAQDIEITRAACIADAESALEDGGFDVVLLDLHLPDATGRESVERIQRADGALPIVVLSGQSDEDYAVKILNRGVQDYLVKWEGGGRIILRAIRYAIERKRTDLKLNYLARYDSLTGIPNRQYFQDQLEGATRRARRGGNKLGLLYLDLDRFKSVNDTLGHQIGDELLCAVADRLKDGIRSGDHLARLGGDEFAVLLEDVRGPLELEAAARTIISIFDDPIELDGRAVGVTVSIGITLYPSDNHNPLALLNNADIAMYQAKDTGRNSYKFFTQSMHEEIIEFHKLEGDLRRALEQDEFELVYQPQIGLGDHRIRALEALIRWNHPERGVVMPDDFISVAEENGLIVDIGQWVLERCCQQIWGWQQTGLPVPRVAVNISPVHFHQADFDRQVQKALGRYSISESSLELELTESSLMEDTLNVQTCLHTLKSMGLRLSVDDFGTGYSCLNYLKKFPIDVLKIDRSFVSDLDRSEDGRAICGVILSIAKSLSLESVGEGVETESQLEFLRKEGCMSVQGFYFSTPMSAEQITEQMKQKPENFRPAEELDGTEALVDEALG